ncbi:MAG: hypothetical protein SF339_00595 [Blastocatellia bacterium]|nr:hypothetical protein [Blastocatellia bacterium]
MRTSRKLTHALLALFALVMMSAAALAADPGLVYPTTSEVSDQKAGSILFYNYYTSGATSGNAENTRINITNTSSTSAAFVHLFFVANTCQVADSYICLTANQTASFLASDVDPGVTGYIVAVSVSGVTGCPVAFNSLIGDEYVKTATGHAANLGAEAFAALYAGTMPGCDETSPAATINFNGTYGNYNMVPRVLAASSIPSRADGNDTLVIINRVGGNLATGASTLSSLFGLMYDDSESVFSFSVTGGCQLRNSLSNTFPRTTPRFETVIPAGRTGWAKIWGGGNIGILGSIINANPNAAAAAGAFNGGRNLHKLTLTTDAYVIPVFPPSC